MTKTDLYRSCMATCDLRIRPARGPAPTGSDFRHNFSKNYPQDLKMAYKDAPRNSLQSALKIRY